MVVLLRTFYFLSDIGGLLEVRSGLYRDNYNIFLIS